jgi:hypothetical protein
LMTANIVLFLRVRSRPRTRPGRLFSQSFVMGSISAATLGPRKNKQREKNPAPGWADL